MVRDVTDVVLAEETLRHAAHHDALTGLPHRAALEERLATALAVARRDQDPGGRAVLRPRRLQAGRRRARSPGGGPRAGDPEELAERVRIEVGRPVPYGEHLLVVSVSLGVARVDGDTSPAEVLRHADTALYGAKRSGKDQVVSFLSP